MPRRKTSEEEESAGQPTFESALGALEAIVDTMEHEHLPLEDLVKHYEKGTALLASCEKILQVARGRIELITLRNQNEIALEARPDSPEGLDFPLPADPDDDDANDIRLF